MSSIVEVSDLSVVYGSTKEVNGISFRIGRGEIFGLLGRNGAGKTSTLSAIEGLLTPLSGSVLVDGINVRENPRGARQRLGVALQATSFQPELTVGQVLRLYAGLYGVRLTKDQVAARLSDAGLNAMSNRHVRQLSGGQQQQRLVLSVALVHDPLLLLLLATGTPRALIDGHRDDGAVRDAAHGETTLEDVFIGLTGSMIDD